MRFSIFILLIIIGFSSRSQDGIVKSIMLDSVMVSAVSSGFSVDEFIHYVKSDTTFYQGFKNLRYYSHQFQSKLEIFDKSNKSVGILIRNGHYEIGGINLYLHHGELEKGEPAALPNAPDATFAKLDPGNETNLVLFGHTHVQFKREIGDRTYINPGSVGQPRCGRLHACYGVFIDGVYSPRHVIYDPTPWLDALDKITPLKDFPDFHNWLREGLLKGYGIGEKEPWTGSTSPYPIQKFCS